MTLTELNQKKSTIDESELDHIYCECNPDISLCGIDISHTDFNPVTDEDLCLVCKDLDDEGIACDRCGY